MNRGRIVVAIATLASLALPAHADAAAAALGGSMSSMRRQHDIALTSQFDFMRTASDVREHIESGQLVHVPGGIDYALSNVSFPYAVDEVRLFIERLAAEYRLATGERMVVTSLTRPLSQQPGNAHELSVHPAGMAVDLRVPARASARIWLQKALLDLEKEGVLDVTREYRPPHFHVAVYPAEYRAYADSVDAERALVWAQVMGTVVTVQAESEVSATPTESEAISALTPRSDDTHRELPLLLGSMAASIGLVTMRRRSTR